ncbi:MAG: universal stress protein [Chloroflexi bacterium]|nr:universal stress protein [Chloroflexota bacterium]
MFTKILVPLDGSDEAEAALEVAAEIARRFDSQVVLLEVTPGYGPALAATAAEAFGASGSVAAAIEMEKAAEVTASSYLDAVNEEYGGKWQTIVAEGDSAEAIAAQCEATGADLIVMSTHARSGFARLFLGSVVDDVIRRARGVPVLVVHAEDEE